MSGKELNESTKYVNDNAEGEDVAEQVDDDFGDFEGFNNVNELEPSVAQPLPQALQANWGSFPDYVPSQRTMSSSLQPDLLPTQASIGDINACCVSNQEHFLPSDDDDGDDRLPGAQLHLHLHPNLPRVDFQLPDVSPQSNDVAPKMSLLGNLPDISPVGCRPSHLSDLPDVSETRSNQSIKALPPKCESLGSLATIAALDASCIPCCSKSLGNSNSPKSNNDNVEMVVSDFQQQFAELKQQNKNLAEELVDMKSQNTQCQQMLLECVGIIRQQHTASQEESNRLRSEVSHLCEGIANMKMANNLDKSGSTSTAEQTPTFSNAALEVKLSEQMNSLQELKKHAADQDEQVRTLRTEMASMSRNVEGVQQSQQEIVGILKQMLDEFKSERQNVAQKMDSIERVLHSHSSQVDKRVDQNTYTATLLDTLLLGAHHQLQELVKPDNGPSS